MLGRDCRRFLDYHLNPPLPSSRSLQNISVFCPQRNINLFVPISRIVFILSTGKVLIHPVDIEFRIALESDFDYTKADNFLFLQEPEYFEKLKSEFQDQFVSGRLRSTQSLVWININHVHRVEESVDYHNIIFGEQSLYFKNSNDSPLILQVNDLSDDQIKLINDPENWEEIRLE